MAEARTVMQLDVKFRTVSEVKAEALREAADRLYSDDGPDNPLSVADWLRKWADDMDPATPKYKQVND